MRSMAHIFRFSLRFLILLIIALTLFSKFSPVSADLKVRKLGNTPSPPPPPFRNPGRGPVPVPGKQESPSRSTPPLPPGLPLH
ncbi:putative transmembrane protein [Sesbania bispinosa]|nr:putative transmembrane protein [Sesbania bispinosa]